MTAPDATRILVVCDGASVPAALDAERWDHRLAVNADSSAGALTLKVENLSGKVVASLDGRAQDLIRIAAACYGADQMVSRGGNDVHREKWRRVFCVVLPVIDRAFWSDVEVVGALAEAIGYGTEDTWWFAFGDRAPAYAQMRLLDDEPWYGAPDCVALFSGGTDSLCALVEAIAADGRRPVVVSHRPAGHIDHWQRELLGAVRAEFRDWQLPQMSFWIHKKQTRASDVSQRTRGFLFAALGTAVAGQLGVRDVLLPDNGYVSINPPISGQMVGALASRGTHPAFLRLFNRLAGRVFARPVVVANPLADRTRAEALGVLARFRVPHLLRSTHTCGKHQRRTSEQPHCGGCSQCIDRRFSALAAGLAEYDPAGDYALDVFRDALPEGEARTVALSYVDFARKTEREDPGGLFAMFEELVACVDPDEPNFGAAAERIGLLLNRHGREVIGVLADRFAAASRDVARGDPAAFNLVDLLAPPRAADRTETVPPSVAAGTPTAGPSDWNACRLRVGYWNIAFHGDKAVIPHRKGMTQLALLLQSPRQPLDMMALARCEAQPARAPEATSNGFAHGIDGTFGELMTEDTVRLMERRKAELPREIQVARARGNTAGAARLAEDLRVIKRELKKAHGLGGRAREHGGSAEKARKAVSKNIHEVLDLIELDLRPLREHLDDSLHLGIPPDYAPNPHEQWVVEL